MTSIIDVLTAFDRAETAAKVVGEHEAEYTDVPGGGGALPDAVRSAQATHQNAADECGALLAKEWWKPGTH
ncbi:MAG TPA: hypothetical protein VG346_04950 [Acidimicrobiales bacterium]|jgi:hypothetical protein|nr:hypothetical protein [Acidimicrobiales bacterium]